MYFKLLLITSFIFIGCNNNSSSVSSNADISTGYLIDAKVSGVEVQCDNIKSITKIDGSFKFDYSCDYIVFKIGSVVLAEMPRSKINKDKKFFITDIANTTHRNDTNNSSVKNIIRLLQTLDEDMNPENGIDINETTRNNITNTIPFNISESNINEDDLKNIIIDANLSRELVTPIKALVHFEQTLRDHNISVDTVPPYLPYTKNKLLATSNDIEAIDIYGEKNTQIYINGVYSNLSIPQTGKYESFELNTSGDKNTTVNLSITLKDNYSFSKPLVLNILKDLEPLDNFIFVPTVTITKPSQYVFDLNVTDNSEEHGLSLIYTITGKHNELFKIENKKLYFISEPIVGVYNINIEVSDYAKNKINSDINITVN